MSIWLEIFVLVNMLIVGIVGTLAVQHLFAHRKEKNQSKKPEFTAVKIPDELKEALIEDARTQFEKEVTRATKQLQTNLSQTVNALNSLGSNIAGQIIETEMKRYRETLESLRTKTEETIGTAQASVTKHQEEISAELDARRKEFDEKLNQELAEKRAKLIEQMEMKLSDAVTSFLAEALQYDIDLGAQGDYLIDQLNKHKDEIIGQVKRED